MNTSRWLMLTLLLLPLLGCQNRSASSPELPPAAAAPASSPTPGAAPQPPTAPSPGAASAGGLRWQESAPFERRASKSSMRAAEYGLSGDESTELAVFYFGPDQGGSVDANVSRWIGQFTQPDGSPSTDKAKRETRKVGDLEVTMLELAGNYSGGMAMPGAPQPSPQTDAMLLAAIVAGPKGPVFFKLVGPRATAERIRADFDRMIGSLTPE
jgi:hypothetical protein